MKVPSRRPAPPPPATYEAALEEIAELKARLAALQRMPALDWARACSLIMRAAASAAKAGYQTQGQAMAKGLDLAKTYVARLEAERDELKVALQEQREHW